MKKMADFSPGDQVTHKVDPLQALLVESVDGERVTCIVPGKNLKVTHNAADLKNHGRPGPMGVQIL